MDPRLKSIRDIHRESIKTLRAVLAEPDCSAELRVLIAEGIALQEMRILDIDASVVLEP